MPRSSDGPTRPPAAAPAKLASPFREIVPPGTRFPFVRFWRPCALFSLGLLLACAVALPLRGIRLGVDFAGGYLLQVQVSGEAPATEAGLRAALMESGIPAPRVTRLGAPGEATFQVRFPASPHVDTSRLPEQLARDLTPLGDVRVERLDFVGPRVGAELTRSALTSMGVAFALILAYVAFRFAPAYAPGAVVALVHDVGVTAGLFVLFGWEFDLDIVAALLTTIGYSLNDTLVIYDRIRENRERHDGAALADVIDRSLNETLSRTLLTSGTTLLAVLALLLLGGPELRGFSMAMAIGIVVGTYSSVYVASPLVLLVERIQFVRRSPVPRRLDAS